jgi:rubrerythrin
MSTASDCQNKDRVWLLFDICRDIEGSFAELYHFYSDHFKDDAEIARMWKKTAMEEENHQHQFAMARRMMSNMQCVANVDIDIAVDVRDNVAKLVANAIKRPPNLASALKRSIELEEKLSVFHAGTIVSFTDPGLKNMFSAMLCFDKEHVETLRQHYAGIMHKSE